MVDLYGRPETQPKFGPKLKKWISLLLTLATCTCTSKLLAPSSCFLSDTVTKIFFCLDSSSRFSLIPLVPHRFFFDFFSFVGFFFSFLISCSFLLLFIKHNYNLFLREKIAERKGEKKNYRMNKEKHKKKRQKIRKGRRRWRHKTNRKRRMKNAKQNKTNV